MTRLKVLELFAGIGACSKALERLGIEHEIVDAVEIDKYAIKSFNAIHNTNFESQDICEWDKDIEVDLIMHGSPCQDFSLAGKQAGGDKDSGTRSSLMYETIRIVEKLKPKYVIWENVKNLLSKKHIHNFNAYLETMKNLGYTNYYQVLNAKDYGIPQNRERVFTVSVLGNESYEFPKGVENNNKIIEHNPKGKHQQDFIQDESGLCRCIPAGTHGSTPHLLKTVVRNYEFPPKQELKLKLKDMLEDEVDEKYYLSDIAIDKLKRHNNKIVNNDNPDESSTLHAGYYKMGGRDQQYIRITEATKLGYKEAFEGDGVNISSRMKYQRGNVQKESIQTLTTSGGNERGVIVKENSFITKHYNNFINKKGYVPEMFNPYHETEIKEIAPTQSTYCGSSTSSATVLKNDGLRIRKLTPKECWRLMGFDDKDFEKAAEVNSNTQLYKQAGNSIVVNVLEAVFKNLFGDFN